MRIIKKNTECFEREYTCHYCKSIFAFTYDDMEIGKDIDGGTFKYVNCPVCGSSLDLDGVKNLPIRDRHRGFTDYEDK